MEKKEEFETLINSINSNSKEIKEFASTARSKNKRIFSLFNTNIKTLGTYYMYLNDVRNNKTKDNHQKYEPLSDLRVFYSADDPLTAAEKTHRNVRGNILEKGYSFFDTSSFFGVYLIFILSLNSHYKTEEEAKKILSIMPQDLVNNYQHHLKKVLSDSKIDISNPVQSLNVFYGNKKLFEAMIDFYVEDYQGFTDYMKSISKLDLINKRLPSELKSSYRYETIIPYLYSKFVILNFKNLSYEEIIDKIIDLGVSVLNELDYQSFSRILTYDNSEKSEIREFFIGLSDSEKKEILYSLGAKESDSVLKSFEYIDGINQGRALDKRIGLIGRTVKRTVNVRQGQDKLRKDYFALHGDDCKCAILNCKIHGKQHLGISHILAWRLSSPEEKVDFNNVLPLCPAHDHLFDNLYISFDENGNILISKDVDSELCKQFNVDENTKIKTNQEIEKYMSKHREAFVRGAWEE